jgi:hypothetical protein
MEQRKEMKKTMKLSRRIIRRNEKMAIREKAAALSVPAWGKRQRRVCFTILIV